MTSRRGELLRLAGWTVGMSGLVAILVLVGDQPIAAVAGGLDGPLAEFLRSINHIGRATWYLIGIAIALLPLAAWRMRTCSWRDAALLNWTMAALLFFAASVALPGLIADLIKFLGGRPRPRVLGEVPYYDFTPFGLDSDFHSFPSGHATTLFGLAFALAFFVPRLRWTLLLVAAILSSTRMLVGAHYASDIVASAGIAGLTTYALRAWWAGRRLVFTRRADGTIGVRPAGRLLGRRMARLCLRGGRFPARAQRTSPPGASRTG